RRSGLSAEADLNLNASCKVQFHQRIDSLVGGLNDIQHPLVGTDFILIPGIFVDVRRNQHGKTLFACRQRNRTTHLSPSTLRGIHDFLGRLINQAMVKSLQPNTNLLVLHLTRNSKLLFSEHTRTQAGPSKGGAILQMRHSSVNQNTKAPDHRGLLLMVRLSGDDLGNHAGANGTAAFANRETQAFFHGDRSDQGHVQLDVVARHDHFNAFGQFAGTGHVSGPEVELRTVALEERSVTAAFVLAQHVHFGFEAGVRLDGARLGQNLTTLNVFALGTTQQNTNVLTGTAFVQQLAEHLDTGTGSLGGVLDADDLDFFLNLDDAALNTTGYHSTATGNGEHVFDRHQERLVDGALGLGDVAVQRLYQRLHSGGAQTVVVTAFQRHQRGTDDDRGVVAGEVVGAQQVANFHLDQLQQLLVIDHVSLVQNHDDVGNTDVTGTQDVRAGVRQTAVTSRADQDSAVHLANPGDHLLQIVSVTGAVNLRVVTGRGIILTVGRVD